MLAFDSTKESGMSEYSLAMSDAEIRRYTMMAERAQASEAPLWEAAGIVPGAIVADVGCGPATASVCMARVVEPSGRVIGIEPDDAALAAAHRVVKQAGVGNVELRQASATESGLAPGSVDVAVIRHVLAHNGPDEQKIVDHLAELVRPGGRVYLVDVDGTAVRMLDADPDLADLHDKYIQYHKGRGNDLLVGLRLAQLIGRAGLEVVAHEGRYSIVTVPPGVRPPAWAARQSMLADGVATPEDIARWEAALDRMDDAEVRPTVFIPNFFATGLKPQ
jgi:ubiquinone/menaquinone biosynthesis C-methylase UbiE